MQKNFGLLQGRNRWLPILLFLGFLIFFTSARVGAETPFEDGRLFLVDGSSISRDDFAARAAGADYILIGETHDAPHHHRMQADLLETLAKAGLRPAVGFEMLYSRNQKLLEPFNRHEIKLGELEQASGWSQSWSYPFAIYAPIFQVAERYDLPVYGLNISKATLDKVKAEGFEKVRDNLPAEERPDLPAEVIWPLEEQVAHLNKIREGFSQWQRDEKPGGNGPKEAAAKPPKADPAAKKADQPANAAEAARPGGDPKRFMLVQSLWDTSMAESAARARRESGRPVVIIAGGGHVESGYGIAHRLNSLDPGRKIMLVMPLSHPFKEGEDKRRASAEVFFASRPSILSLGLVFKAEADRIIVDELTAGSRAEAAGIKIGDRIISLEEKAMKSPGDFHSAIAIADLQDKRNKLDDKREKPLLVERAGQERNLILR